MSVVNDKKNMIFIQYHGLRLLKNNLLNFSIHVYKYFHFLLFYLIDLIYGRSENNSKKSD